MQCILAITGMLHKSESISAVLKVKPGPHTCNPSPLGAKEEGCLRESYLKRNSDTVERIAFVTEWQRE